jgi:putative phosphoesterase
LKKILLISDSHGWLDEKLIKHIKNCDEVWHAGDIGNIKFCKNIESLKPFKAVYGNIDGHDLRSQFGENECFSCEEVKVVMTHIGGSPGKYPARVKDLLNIHKPNIYIAGHSHILKVIYDHQFQLLHLNPGACGIQGFHQVKTALRFEINTKEIKNLEIVEFGKRNEQSKNVNL